MQKYIIAFVLIFQSFLQFPLTPSKPAILLKLSRYYLFQDTILPTVFTFHGNSLVIFCHCIIFYF